MQRLEATIHGLVQGVAFRYYTQRTARRLGLTGWVANQADGTVRVVAEGGSSALQALLDFLQQGPPAASVTRVDAAYAAATGEFTDFGVRYR